MRRVDPTIDTASKANIAHEVDQLVRQADTGRGEGDLGWLYLSVAEIPHQKRVNKFGSERPNPTWEMLLERALAKLRAQAGDGLPYRRHHAGGTFWP